MIRDLGRVRAEIAHEPGVTTGPMRCRPVLLAVALASLGCHRASPEVTVVFEPDDPHDFTRAERAAVEEVAERTVPEIRRVLPGLPGTVELRVQTARHVLPETGETGSNAQPNVVHWMVDASRPEGIAAIARAQLRATLFHELDHLVRAAAIPNDRRIRDHAVREGLATAFERDFAGAAAPWGQYPPEVAQWTRELLALPDDAPRETWLFHHPDGRRWVAMRVGTYLVDRVKQVTGKTSAELVRMPTDDVVRLGTEGMP